MSASMMERLIEHNNWANALIIQACLKLNDEQLDAAPKSATMGTIRETLLHLVKSQRGYYRLLTTPVEERRQSKAELAFNELEDADKSSGQALLALARDSARLNASHRLETTDGYWVDPWLVWVQIVNHATEHREQIKSMLTALGVTPPELDGWAHGEATHTLVPVEAKGKS